jgi:uncharacterized membrane protein YobD (UPF0266 family)
VNYVTFPKNYVTFLRELRNIFVSDNYITKNLYITNKKTNKMGNISDINIRIAEITNNMRMVIFTKCDDLELIDKDKINHRIKAKRFTVNKNEFKKTY